jgi:hypothetical protein
MLALLETNFEYLFVPSLESTLPPIDTNIFNVVFFVFRAKNSATLLGDASLITKSKVVASREADE